MSSSVAVLLYLLVGMIVFVIVGVIFATIDRFGLKYRTGPGMVMGKIFMPAHTTASSMYSAVDRGELPNTLYYPDKWSVRVQIGKQSEWVSVSKGLYESLASGDTVTVKFTFGRLTRDLYVSGIVE